MGAEEEEAEWGLHSLVPLHLPTSSGITAPLLHTALQHSILYSDVAQQSSCTEWGGGCVKAETVDVAVVYARYETRDERLNDVLRLVAVCSEWRLCTGRGRR